MALKSLNFTLLVFNLSSDNFTLFEEELQKKRMMAPEFFLNAPIVVNIEDNEIDIDFTELKKVIKNQFFNLVGISGLLSPNQKENATSNSIAILSCSKRQAVKSDIEINKEQAETQEKSKLFVPNYVTTKVHTGRVRSGQQIYAKDCDLVIIGDVSHGAEIIADGSIHVYGTLRGKALAGVMGETSAAIYCTKFEPELLSISGVYKLSEDLPKEFFSSTAVVTLIEQQMKFTNLNNIKS